MSSFSWVRRPEAISAEGAASTPGLHYISGFSGSGAYRSVKKYLPAGEAYGYDAEVIGLG